MDRVFTLLALARDRGKSQNDPNESLGLIPKESQNQIGINPKESQRNFGINLGFRSVSPLDFGITVFNIFLASARRQRSRFLPPQQPQKRRLLGTPDSSSLLAHW